MLRGTSGASPAKIAAATRPTVTSNRVSGPPQVGDILTINPPPGATVSSYSLMQDKGSGLTVIATAQTYTLQAGDIPPIGSSYAYEGDIVISDFTSPSYVSSNPATVPGAPTIGTATAGNAQISSTFTAPTSNGGSAITNYLMSVFLQADNSLVGQSNTASSPGVLTGIANGVAVYCTFIAQNAVGNSVPSAASNVITPSANPSYGPFVQGASYTRNIPYIVTTGDDFNGPSLDIISPANALGKYVTTQYYAAGGGSTRGPRGFNGATPAPGLLGYEADPWHTGFNDSNRGVAIASYSDSLVQASSNLTLKSRTSPSGEAALNVSPSTLTNNSAMIGSFSCVSVTAPFVITASIALTKSRSSMLGWHDTFWANQIDLTAAHAITTQEIDWESNSTQTFANRYDFQNGTGTPSLDGSPIVLDGSGAYHLKELEVWQNPSDNSWNLSHWYDNGVHKTVVLQGDFDPTKPFAFYFTNHIAPGTGGSDVYNSADWVAAGAPGATTAVDYWVISTKTGTLLQPQVSSVTQNVNFNDTVATTINLPSATTLWGSAITDNLVIAPLESNEPSGNYFGGYRGLPLGAAYNTSTNVLTITPANMTRPGRLQFFRHPMVSGGVAGVPHRVVVNVGPNVSVSALTVATKSTAYSFDLYAVCDCGVLVSDANGNKAKTISVTGLPTGFSYSDTTGLVTGQSALDFNVSLTVTVTNSIGQIRVQLVDFSTTIPVTANTSVPAPVIAGVSTAPLYSFDFNDPALQTLGTATPPQINSSAGADGTAVAVANASATTSPTRVARTNGALTADFSSASTQFLQATGLTVPSGGTFIIVYEPITVNANQTIFEKSLGTSATGTNREALMALLANNGVSARRGDSAGVLVDAQTPTQRNTAAIHCAVCVFDTAASTSPTLYFDGASGAFTGTTNGQPVGMTTLTVGARMASSALGLPFNGYVYRIIAYPPGVIFTAAQAEQAAVWARAKYGTPNSA